MADTHPLLAELKSLCKLHGLHEGKAQLAFELYRELCEVLKLWDVRHHFNEELKVFYLTGKVKADSDEFKLYIPVTMDETLTLDYLELLQETLSSDNNSVIIAFKETDSSSAHYSITRGLARPESLEAAQKKRTDEKKNLKYQRYLHMWRKRLYENAMKSEALVI